MPACATPLLAGARPYRQSRSLSAGLPDEVVVTSPALTRVPPGVVALPGTVGA